MIMIIAGAVLGGVLAVLLLLVLVRCSLVMVMVMEIGDHALVLYNEVCRRGLSHLGVTCGHVLAIFKFACDGALLEPWQTTAAPTPLFL